MKGLIGNVHSVYGLNQSQPKSGLICNHFVQLMQTVNSFFQELLIEFLLACLNFSDSSDLWF